MLCAKARSDNEKPRVSILNTKTLRFNPCKACRCRSFIPLFFINNLFYLFFVKSLFPWFEYTLCRVVGVQALHCVHVNFSVEAVSCCQLLFCHVFITVMISSTSPTMTVTMTRHSASMKATKAEVAYLLRSFWLALYFHFVKLF